jgi:hypothetical protein
MSAMSLPKVWRAGERVSGLEGADVDLATGRLLTVAELQLALRAVRAEAPLEVPTASTGRRSVFRRSSTDVAPELPTTTAGHSAAFATHAISPRVVGVVAAHAGAGASTVALAIADVATGRGPVHLVEWCHPRMSGLASVTTRELGISDDGAWRRGSRGDAVLDRRAGDARPASWPDPAETAWLTLADLGHLIANDLRAGLPLVVVCRATVPGVRHAEHLLRDVESPVAIAAVGPSRWPGSVLATAGPCLRAYRETGRLVAVPVDRKLESTGLTAAPLTKSVLAAGRELLELLAGITDDRTTAPPAPRQKGSRP